MVKRKIFSETQRDATINAYRGWTGVPGTAIDAIQASDITPQSFWKHYVSQRKPVILKGHSLSTNLDQLAVQAGDVIVDVESRSSDTASFGMGKKHKMEFKSFINAIQKGQSNLYLTTQNAPMGPDGQPELASPLLSRLLNLNDDDSNDGNTNMNSNAFPLRPSLIGNLVPHAINLWMGCASSTHQGSSSRLHHDFHDNVYHLLQGRKTFVLYPPSTATCMYTKGTIRHIYPNGRVVYTCTATNGSDRGNVPKADGSTEREVGIWLRRTKAEEALAEAEAAVERGDVGSMKMLEKAEEELDEVLMRALETGGGGDDDDGDDDDDDDRGGGGTQDPDSFSMVDLKLTDKQLRQKFPLFPGKSAAIYADLEEDDIFYLPAGWFHEVTSYGGHNSTDSSNNVHFAVNYWFYPPDNINSKEEDGYKRPYVSLYWPEFWKEREARYRSDGGGDLTMMEEEEEEEEDDEEDREIPPLSPTQRRMYGYFGYGRRRELFRFIRLKDCTIITKK